MKATSNIIARRQAHHAALEKLRGPKCKKSGFQLWRACRRLETIAHAGATAYCNGDSMRVDGHSFDFRSDENAWDSFTEVIKSRVVALFGSLPSGFRVNGDARGHALKIAGPESGRTGGYIPEGMDKDWGGNGILAADIQ